jgi:hypothetical protein
VTQGRALPAVTYSINDGTHAGRTIDSPLRLTGARDWTEVTCSDRRRRGRRVRGSSSACSAPARCGIDDLVVEWAFGRSCSA